MDTVTAQIQDRTNFPVVGLRPGAFFVSEVIDSTAWYGTVIVAPPMGGPIQGVPLQAGSGTWGPRQIGVAYPPHTKVMCYQPTDMPFCYVVGAIPDWVTSAKFNKVPSWIVMACRSGFGFDPVHYERVKKPQGVQADINFSAGAPADDLPGDYGFVNELGLGYGIGRLMAWMRASHFCGIEAHWIDNLLRLTSYNYEHLTASGEQRAVDDEGEWNDVARWSPFPWESRGVFDSSSDFSRKGNGDWNQSGMPQAAREPVFEDQMGIWRVQQFRGYLGDLDRTFVSLPQRDSYSEGPERMANRTVMPGLLDVGFSSDGHYHVRSAKGIVLEKNVAIPIPKELIAPDDPTGDGSENYMAAGVYGSGESHDKELADPVEDGPGLRALMRFDRHALLHSFYDNIGFHRHEQDWYLPEESESLTQMGLLHGLYRSDADVLDDAFWMPLPQSVERSIDHRGSSRFFAGRAAIEIADDGSVVVEDAYGSQVRLEGGNAFVTARNDIVMQPGRNFTVLAPNDIVLRAGNCVDISGGKGDVRVKADGNLMMSSQRKGVLIEANDEGATPDWEQIGEAVESSGVMIKAPRSSIVTMSRDTYIRSGTLEGDRTSGELHIDAGAGNGAVYVHGGTVTQRALRRAETIVGSTGSSEATASLDLQPTAFVLGGKSLQNVNMGGTNFSLGHEDYDVRVNVQGDLFVSKGLWVDGNAAVGETVWAGANLVVQKDVWTNGSAIFTGAILCHDIASDKSQGMLAPTGDDFNASDQIPPEHPAIAKEQLDSDKEQLRSALQQARQEDNGTVTELEESLYGDESRFASAALVNNATFTFRTPENYGTSENFTLPETRWQQFNRLLFGAQTVWREDAIASPSTGRETMPYPGFEVWENQKALVVMNHAAFDFERGVAANRADIESRGIGDVELKRLSAGYIVTRQNGAATEE